jgi:hypothetical protein
MRMFCAGKSLCAALGMVGLLSGTATRASAQDEMQKSVGSTILRNVADLRKPFSPEPLGGQVGDAGAATGQYILALRLGLSVSPRTRFAGGIDVTLPRLSLGKGLTTRIDAETIVSANFGGISTLIPLTFNQVYSAGSVSRTRVYVGAGIGPYFGEITRFGGKVFVGAGLSEKIGVELGVHFPGFDDPMVTLQARLPFAF